MRRSLDNVGDRVVVVGVAVAVPLLIVGIMLALRRPLQRRWFAGTGWEEWRATARRLPWRDRVRLERANTRGRACTPDLAALAVQRGRTLTAVAERTHGSRRVRWSYRALALTGVVLVALDVGELAMGDGDTSTWFQLVPWLLLTPMYASMPRLQRRQLRRFRRSVDLNEALADRSAITPPAP